LGVALRVRVAAERLRVTEQEVRRLIGVRELAATRFGGSGQWQVDAAAVDQRVARRPVKWRPWVPAVAWAAMWLLSGLGVDWLSRGDLARLRRRLAAIDDLDVLVASLRRRAAVEYGRILPEYVDRVASAQGVVRTGVSATAETGADLVSTGAVDLYCAPDQRPSLIARYGVDLSSANSNLTLRTPTGDGLPVLVDRDVMPPAVVAVDLYESLDPRTHRAGHDVLVRLIEQVAGS
jgi:excisionase family DNA binding protein